MFNNIIIPLLASMHNVTICLEKIIEKTQVESVALIHLNTTVDFADTIYEQLTHHTDYAWMRFNMANNETLKNRLMENNLINKMFYVYVLETVLDWPKIYNFIILSKLNHREKQIYIVNRYSTLDELKNMGYLTYQRQFYNWAVLFWNSSGHSQRIEAYTFDGFDNNATIKFAVTKDQCSNIYEQIFFEKETNFHGLKMTIYGNAEPPRIVKTVDLVNGQHEYSIGGHDVLINDVIAKHLNATAKYKLLLVIIHLVNTSFYAVYENPLKSRSAFLYNQASSINYNPTQQRTHASIRSAFMKNFLDLLFFAEPKDNIEEKVFNVSQIERYDWEVPLDTLGYSKIYSHPAVDMISQQMNYQLYLETRRYKDYAFLYPHDMDNFVIIVPKKLNSHTEYTQIFKSPLILVWGPITIIASIFRYILKKIVKTDETDEKFIEIFFQTFGLSLGISFNEAGAGVGEKLLLWWFCLGTMLSGMILSSSMFQGFALRIDVPTINNWEELEASGLEIQLPSHIESIKNYFENLPVNLKVTYSVEYSISEMIYNGNASYAYVIRERKFNILFKDNADMWHVVERFGNEYLSYKLRLYAGIEDRMNNIVQRCVEYGIVNYLVAKNERILTDSRSTVQKVNPTIVKPVSVNEMKDPLMLYAVGIVLSSITAIVEGFHFRKCFIKRK